MCGIEISAMWRVKMSKVSDIVRGWFVGIGDRTAERGRWSLQVQIRTKTSSTIGMRKMAV